MNKKKVLNTKKKKVLNAKKVAKKRKNKSYIVWNNSFSPVEHDNLDDAHISGFTLANDNRGKKFTIYKEVTHYLNKKSLTKKQIIKKLKEMKQDYEINDDYSSHGIYTDLAELLEQEFTTNCKH